MVPQQVIYQATDGMQIHGQLFLPPNSRPGEKHQAVVFMHGGSRRQMLLGWHYMDYYNNAYAMNQYLASLGYVVLSINYRSGIGYGMEFREAINYGAAGASEFNDVEGAGLYLRGRADVDPQHIGLWGGSYGGYLTALGLARACRNCSRLAWISTACTIGLRAVAAPAPPVERRRPPRKRRARKLSAPRTTHRRFRPCARGNRRCC